MCGWFYRWETEARVGPCCSPDWGRHMGPPAGAQPQVRQWLPQIPAAQPPSCLHSLTASVSSPAGQEPLPARGLAFVSAWLVHGCPSSRGQALASWLASFPAGTPTSATASPGAVHGEVPSSFPLLFSSFQALGIKCRALYLLGKHSITELHLQTILFYFYFIEAGDSAQ